GDEEAMSVANIVVKRIAVAELVVVIVETAAKGVSRVLLENVARILLFRSGGGLELGHRPAESRCGQSDTREKKQARNVFHKALQVSSRSQANRLSQAAPMYRKADFVARLHSRAAARKFFRSTCKISVDYH